MSRHYRILLLHCFIWGALMCCVLLMGPRPPEARQVPWNIWQIVWSVVSLIGLFYAHAYWLMPAYLFRKKQAAYWSLVVGAGIATACLSGLAYYMNNHPPGHFYYHAVLRRLVVTIFFILASASLGAFAENARLEKARKERETDHLRTELAFLRGQVNPHFMLNVLNSMVLMARKRSELLEPALLELAGLMRYSVYEADHEKISLEELEYLRAYIDLQMLRFRDDVKVEFNVPATLVKRSIEPMLLIPLVENAFKHGIGQVETPLIRIDVAVAEEFSMMVMNKYNAILQEEAGKPGIGLINLKKRLELIYPGRYQLTTLKSYRCNDQTTEHWYSITLQIPLS